MIILPIQFLARAASFFHTIAFPFAMMRSNRMARFHSAWEKIRICVSARAFISNSRIQMIPKRTRSVSILVEEGCNLRLIKRCLRGREELESLIASLFEAFHDPSVRPPIYEINKSPLSFRFLPSKHLFSNANLIAKLAVKLLGKCS